MPIGVYVRSKEQIEKLLLTGFKVGNKPKHCFAKGNTLRRGVKMTDEQRKRMSESHKGLKQSLESREKRRIKMLGLKRPYMLGDKNPKWRGGVTPLHEKERKCSKYVIWRRDVFIRDEFTCQKCGKTNIYVVAHHIKPFSKYPDLRFDVGNGQTLCVDCHKLTDSYAKNTEHQTE